MQLQTLHFVSSTHALLGDLSVCYSSSLVAHVTHTTNLFESPLRLWSRDLFDSLLWPRIFLSFLGQLIQVHFQDNISRHTQPIQVHLAQLGSLLGQHIQAHLGPFCHTLAHLGLPSLTQGPFCHTFLAHLACLTWLA